MKFELTNNEANNQEENPIEWIKWFEPLNADGVFSMNADRVSFKEESQPVFFVINESENVGTSVFCAHHPNAKFTDATPHGVRLANAIGRFFEITGSVDADQLVDLFNAHAEPLEVRAEKTEKGILWSVQEVKK